MTNSEELTTDQLDDLVHYWHTQSYLEVGFTDFMCFYTGWTEQQLSHWIETSEQPSA